MEWDLRIGTWYLRSVWDERGNRRLGWEFWASDQEPEQMAQRADSLEDAVLGIADQETTWWTETEDGVGITWLEMAGWCLERCGDCWETWNMDGRQLRTKRGSSAVDHSLEYALQRIANEEIRFESPFVEMGGMD